MRMRQIQSRRQIIQKYISLLISLSFGEDRSESPSGVVSVMCPHTLVLSSRPSLVSLEMGDRSNHVRGVSPRHHYDNEAAFLRRRSVQSSRRQRPRRSYCRGASVRVLFTVPPCLRVSSNTLPPHLTSEPSLILQGFPPSFYHTLMLAQRILRCLYRPASWGRPRRDASAPVQRSEFHRTAGETPTDYCE